MMPGTLTLLTPTHNRTPFLRRLIRFWEQIALTHPILVVDSSDPGRAAQNREVCSDAAAHLNIRYVHYDLAFDLKCYQGLTEVETPYVSFCADDDFQFPAVVEQCVHFLAQHDDYSLAQGRVIHANNSRTAHHAVFDCHLLDGYDMEDSDPAERFRQIATRTFSTFYGVYRTPQLAHSFSEVIEYTNYQQGRVFTEAFLLALSVISGKVKVLPEVQYVQETHGENESRIVPRVLNKDQIEALSRRYEMGLRTHLTTSSDQTADEIERLIKQHAHFISGMGGRKQHRRPWRESIGREIHRTRARTIKWLQHMLPLQPTSGHDNAVMQNIQVFPAGSDYDVAKELLRQYPKGIGGEATQRHGERIPGIERRR